MTKEEKLEQRQRLKWFHDILNAWRQYQFGPLEGFDVTEEWLVKGIVAHCKAVTEADNRLWLDGCLEDRITQLRNNYK